MEKAVAGGGDGGRAEQADLLAKELVEVVGDDGQAQDGLGGKELPAAKAGQAEAALELLDDVFHLRAPVVIAPDVQRRDLGPEVGEQGLVLIAGAIEELLAAATA